MYNPRATTVLKIKFGRNKFGRKMILDYQLLQAYISEYFPQNPREPYNEYEEQGVSFFCLGLTDALYTYSKKILMPEEYYHLLNAICFDLQISEEQTKQVYKHAIFDQSLSETRVVVDEVKADHRKIFELGFGAIGCFYDEGKFNYIDFKKNMMLNAVNCLKAKKKSAEARDLIANLR